MKDLGVALKSGLKIIGGIMNVKAVMDNYGVEGKLGGISAWRQ